jgi:hypothetical protein
VPTSGRRTSSSEREASPLRCLETGVKGGVSVTKWRSVCEMREVKDVRGNVDREPEVAGQG